MYLLQIWKDIFGELVSLLFFFFQSHWECSLFKETRILPTCQSFKPWGITLVPSPTLWSQAVASWGPPLFLEQGYPLKVSEDPRTALLSPAVKKENLQTVGHITTDHEWRRQSLRGLRLFTSQIRTKYCLSTRPCLKKNKEIIKADALQKLLIRKKSTGWRQTCGWKLIKAERKVIKTPEPSGQNE